MGLSSAHILIALLVFLLLFGTGKISGLMGDFARGIKSFKKGLTEESEPELEVIDYQATKPVGAPKSVGNQKFVLRVRAGS
jgi:sec-independent protein translocase protein TatA